MANLLLIISILAIALSGLGYIRWLSMQLNIDRSSIVFADLYILALSLMAVTIVSSVEFTTIP